MLEVVKENSPVLMACFMSWLLLTSLSVTATELTLENSTPTQRRELLNVSKAAWDRLTGESEGLLGDHSVEQKVNTVTV